MTMLTKNFPLLKSEVQRHIAADFVAQGNYRGCWIGCLAKGKDDPQYIENTYGIPKIVSRIAESIFEGLPEDEAPAFFAALPDAVACDGKDLSRVPWQFLAAELRALPAVEHEIQAAISSVIKGMDLLAKGKEWREEDSKAAAFAAAIAALAAPAALSAANAAMAAERAAAAANAAMADERAAAAANAARADERAAFAAAFACAAAGTATAAARRRQRDLLLKLISEAPVVGEEQ